MYSAGIRYNVIHSIERQTEMNGQQSQEFEMKAKVTPLEPMDATGAIFPFNDDGCINPFQQDHVRMGTRIGRNVTLMYSNFPSEECREFIVINTRTGERFRVEL